MRAAQIDRVPPSYGALSDHTRFTEKGCRAPTVQKAGDSTVSEPRRQCRGKLWRFEESDVIKLDYTRVDDKGLEFLRTLRECAS